MNEEQTLKFDAYLSSWARENRYIRKYTVSHNQLLGFNGDQVMVNLNLLAKQYHEKFIIGKLGSYANNLLAVLSPGISRFFINEKIKQTKLSFHFKFNNIQLIKDIELKG